MKTYLFSAFSFCMLLSLTSCDILSSNENEKLFSDINNYYRKVSSTKTKAKFVKLLGNTAPIGERKLNAAQIVDDITAETGKYLHDITELMSATEGDNPNANNSLKKSFSLYKKIVEDDIPKLSPNNTNTNSSMKLNENELSKILLEMKQKQSMITQELQNIETELLRAK
jgi:hypothetical protein